MTIHHMRRMMAIPHMRRTFAIVLVVFAIGMTMIMLSFAWQWFTHVTYCPFGREYSPPVPIPPTSRMIVVSRHQEDVSWLPTYFGHTPYIIYNRDDPRATHYQPNVGNEALVYLDFILTNYDSLPNATVFIHGHRESWHRHDIVPMLRYLKWNAPYASLNYERFSSFVPSGRDWPYFESVWPTLFQDTLGDMPRHVNRYCCAEFVVSRERILGRSRAFYQRLYDWLRTTRISSRWSGRVMEHSWGLIFGEPWNVRPIEPRPECHVLECSWLDTEKAHHGDARAMKEIDTALRLQHEKP